MTDRGGDPFIVVISNGRNSEVVERKLDFTGALLAGNQSSNRTVNLVDEPVFAGYSLQLEYLFYRGYKLLCSKIICRRYTVLTIQKGGNLH